MASIASTSPASAALSPQLRKQFLSVAESFSTEYPQEAMDSFSQLDSEWQKRVYIVLQELTGSGAGSGEDVFRNRNQQSTTNGFRRAVIDYYDFDKSVPADVKETLGKIAALFITKIPKNAMDQFNALPMYDRENFYGFLSEVLEAEDEDLPAEEVFNKEGDIISNPFRTEVLEWYAMLGPSKSLQNLQKEFIENVPKRRELFESFPAPLRERFIQTHWMLSSMPEGDPKEWTENAFQSTDSTPIFNLVFDNLLGLRTSLVFSLGRLLALEKALEEKNIVRASEIFHSDCDTRANKILSMSFWAMKGCPDDFNIYSNLEENFSGPEMLKAVKKLCALINKLRY